MLKPSELTPKTSALMARLVAQLFDESELVVIQGGQTTGAAFTSLPFDHLIYTGSTRVGIAIMRAASENLTPLTLELGGKSRVLIGRSADLADAVRRVMTAKIFNAGQGCLLPDYVMVPKGFEHEFVLQATMAIKTLYYFGQDEAEERLVLDQTVSGGVTVNDCITHALAKSLPFGGIGHSGMGAYVRKAGFLTFSHARSIYRQGESSKAELALRPPFTPAFQASLTEAINRR